MLKHEKNRWHFGGQVGRYVVRLQHQIWRPTIYDRLPTLPTGLL